MATPRELRRQMSHREFIGWTIYYARKSQIQEIEAAKAKHGKR